MELFDSCGHITEYGFELLLNGTPDTLESLELAEHLAFCDACCDQYAALLSGQVLLTPDEPLVPSVLGRIRSKRRTVSLRRAFKTGLAAALALGLFFTGISYGIIPTAPEPQAALAQRKDAARYNNTALSLSQDCAAEEAAFDPLSDMLYRMEQSGQTSMAAYTQPAEENATAATLNMRFSYAMDQLTNNLPDRGDD